MSSNKHYTGANRGSARGNSSNKHNNGANRGSATGNTSNRQNNGGNRGSASGNSSNRQNNGGNRGSASGNSSNRHNTGANRGSARGNSSNKYNTGANRGPAEGKNIEEKKAAQKEYYQRKNYKSTPTVFPSSTEKSSLFQYKASSKLSDASEAQSFGDDSRKNNFQNVHKTGNIPPSRNFNPSNTSHGTHTFAKYDQHKKAFNPNIISPQFMAMSEQCQSNSPTSSNLSQYPPKYPHNPHREFQGYGARPKMYQEQNCNDSKSFFKFGNVQNKYMNPGNFKEHIKPLQVDLRRIDTALNRLNINTNKQQIPLLPEPIWKVAAPAFHDRGSNFNAPFTQNNPPPHIKYKKKLSNPNKHNLEPGKAGKGFPKRRRRHNKGKYECGKNVKIPQTTTVTPLWSFQSSIEPENNFDLIHFSDDDDVSTLSQSSLDNTVNLIDFSDVPVSQSITNVPNAFTLSDTPLIPFSDNNAVAESLSGDESDFSLLSDASDESDMTSEFSVDSSVIDSETFVSISGSSITREEAFVSVFWDIENCTLPAKKSAVDFVSYVRGTFYEGRTESTFTVACDVSHLNTNIVRELDEAAVTLIHISSVNKNAADKKIMTLLQRFQIQYRKSNSAIVLISSDSDFSQVLVEMRYQHHIFVNLICNRNTRSSLTTAANNYVLFDDVLKDLPDRNIKNDTQHVLVVANLPPMKSQQIKNCLSEKLKSFNCRIKCEKVVVKIVFKDFSVCEKALSSLKGFYLGGNELDIKYQKELMETDIISKKAKKEIKVLKPVALNIKKIDCPINLLEEIPVTTEMDVGKNVTLCIIVTTNIGNTEYWKNEFQKLLTNGEFSIMWDNTFGGCCLLNFNSLKKAQKAKKLIQKNQMSDPLAPKFFKLIKQEEDLIHLDSNIVNNVEEQNKNKIHEHLQIIEKKKMKFLRGHEKIMEEIKQQASSESSGSAEAVADKLKEYMEQKETFMNFSSSIINTIKVLSSSSENLDEKLKDLLSDFTRECNCIASALPIYAKKEEILRKVRQNQVIIIRAETGSGKSTQLTQYIWREMKNFQNGTIICTQPRKIAAFSLAKHVSFQVGSSFGDIVGYQVGMTSKMSENTRILYVTDFTMLKLLISGDLNRVFCVIVDEAHERTIYTDILLGMIKQCLPNHPHLKVIITSATIDTSIFRDYFSLTDSAVLHISGRTFPIEDVWLEQDATCDGDYFGKTIDKALHILTEEPGDVLAFLTTPLETERALENFNKKLQGRKNVKVFCLHGKMNAEEQQRVFEKTPKGMRKVIFATNCAETSITIPGIKYVIDCGLVKESQYDAIRNMNVLSVGFVSKSSAEQRRGRAGRTQVGKCYRLYSKKNYNIMANNTNPEILRINLGQALLKLLKLGVENPLQFDFVQSPPIELLTSAMDQLQFLSAVDENFVLTELGKNMAALPLEPRLCHLVFQGFDNNIGFDALVTAALVTMSHTIFFRNSENKDEADVKKRRFCESESDFISYLTVYKEWAEVPKNLKSQWCVLNCINARSMRIVHELVNEIILILQKELNFKVKQVFISDMNYDTLTRIIFYSFSQNLAIFSGHPKYGYRCLNVSDPLLIHPSSSLSAFGQLTPTFVVYDTILKTSQTFIVNVSPVSMDMISDGIEMRNLKIDLDALDGLTGIECCITPIGERILFSTFIGKKSIKRRELQRQLKEFTKSDFVEVDIDVSKGCIKIFGFGFDVHGIESFISPILHAAQQSLLNEEKDVYLLEDDTLTAILAAGGHITDVVLPDEFRDVKVTLKGQENIETVVEKLSTCGSITEVREWNKYFKVTFKSPASAKNALSTYNKEAEFSLQKIHRYSHVNERDYLYKVFVSFLRRPCLGVAYITTEPKMDFSSVSSLPDIRYDGREASVCYSKKTGDLRIVNLPANTDKKRLESMVSKILPSGTKIAKCIVTRKKFYESAKDEIELIKNMVIELFAEFTFKEDVTVYLKKPAANDFYWNATVYFKSSLDGETAVNTLRDRKTHTNFAGGLVLKPELQTYLCCKSQIFSVVKEEIQKALQFYKKNQAAGDVLNIDAKAKSPEIVEVKIMSNNIRDITDARRCIHKILTGDEINLDSSNKAKLFSSSGRKTLEKLSSEFQDCYILLNNYNKTISMFGNEDSINKIKMGINAYLSGLEETDIKEIDLKPEPGKTGVFKELLKTYGYDLQKLKEDCDASEINIDKFKRILMVHGNPSALSKCESIVETIKEKLHVKCSETTADTCPVCCDEVSEDKHRLQYCGHVYCTECLLHLFQNAEDIPLVCEEKECQAHIVSSDILWAINGRKALQKVLFDRFLQSFVSSRDDVSFCPSPDCPMVFRITEDRMSIFECPTCGNRICTKCGNLYHGGMTCSFDKCLKMDMDLQKWMAEDPLNRKQCPSCSSPIEKNGGCTHMTCWKCNCHMCWTCLKVFPTGPEVYDHQPFCPGVIL